MSSSRFSFTVRRLIVAIAMLGPAFAVVSWFERTRRRAISYQFVSNQHAKLMVRGSGNSTARMRYHFQLREKYEEAARRPWISVEPDPPEPD